MFLASGFDSEEAIASAIADISAYMDADFASVKNNGNVCRETINFRGTKHTQSPVLPEFKLQLQLAFY